MQEKRRKLHQGGRTDLLQAPSSPAGLDAEFFFFFFIFIIIIIVLATVCLAENMLRVTADVLVVGLFFLGFLHSFEVVLPARAIDGE